jgi:murein DD-endopeptidase MepM/ murein hydrolase activator NlpD
MALGGAGVSAILLLSAAVLAFGHAGHASDRGAPARQAPSPSPSPNVAAAPLIRPGTGAFATVRGLTLFLPASRPVAVAYHEASYSSALRLQPRGTCVRNANRYKFTKPDPTEGPPYVVMSSRGRPHPATSAADVVLRRGTTVVAPATGVVTKIRRYELYGRYEDLRVTITPAGRLSLRVIILHLAALHVHRGSTVAAGVTPLGVPRVFPFRSQVNDYVGAGIPHVHIEVKLFGPTGR